MVEYLIVRRRRWSAYTKSNAAFSVFLTEAGLDRLNK